MKSTFVRAIVLTLTVAGLAAPSMTICKDHRSGQGRFEQLQRLSCRPFACLAAATTAECSNHLKTYTEVLVRTALAG